MDHPFIELQTVDSTNLYAAGLLKKKKVAEGTIIFTHAQTAGQGQGKNKWESESGKNATFSLIFHPVFLPPGQQFMLNKAITLGIIDYLSGLSIEEKLSVKWPNDIYVGNRKSGGILIQNTVCGPVYETCIAGIGVNINQEQFNPALPNPVSIKQLTGITYPVRDTVDSIVAHIDKRYLQLKEGLAELLDREYGKQLLGFEAWRNFFVEKKLMKGLIRGVDESGLLVVEMENGTVRHFNHGEVNFIL